MLTQLLREYPEVRHELQGLMLEVFPAHDVLQFQRKTVYAEAMLGRLRATGCGFGAHLNRESYHVGT
jgi:hypothetical protein